jgi:hypothetical protein
MVSQLQKKNQLKMGKKEVDDKIKSLVEEQKHIGNDIKRR